MFLTRSHAPPYHPPMPDNPKLRPAAADEITTALSFALRYQGRKRVFDADDVMARITAEWLLQHLDASGFVLLKRPPSADPTVAAHLPLQPG